MHNSLFLLPLSLLLALLQQSWAVRIPFTVKFTDKPTASLTRRARLDIGNTGNAQYVANISIAGNEVPVLLDSGSSDLWVHFASPPANRDQFIDTGKHVTLSYAIGRATGNAHRAPVSFGGYTIKDQAFLLVEDASTFTGDIHAQGYDGLFGIGFNTGSVVRKKLDKKNADTTMQNIFNHAKLGSNYITFLLDRQNDPADPFKGEMTISEIIPGFENITSMPKLDVETVTRLLKSDQHWQALTDKNNAITGPDGKTIQVDSIVPRAPSGQLVAVIDSGFTFSQVPREVADQIYGRVKGAVYDTQNEWWLVPCGQYLNIAFNFGGRSYPVHPLDTVDDNFNKIDASGKKVCIGSFQPITTAFSLLGHYDMILGMNFLRSVYTLLDFGDWVDNGEDTHPYIQMVSHTTVENGRSDFVQVRLGGSDTIDTDSRWQLLPFEQMVHSPVSDEEKKKKYQEMVLSRWPYILLGCLAFVALMIGLCIWKCCCSRKKKGGKRGLAGNKRLGFGMGDDRQARQDAEEAYNRGAMSSSGKGGEAYLPLESQSQVNLPATRYSEGRPSAQFDRASQHSGHHPYPQHQQPYSPYHDQYSSSNVDLGQPQQGYADYRNSGHSGHSGYGQQHTPNYGGGYGYR
ncbi:hypothetical protein CC1G_11687 [Coprinopsis cinerea okayama7|uniref:Peptidase A1 domain-containing protein n=1 Tax=Coprinopsis cinerea (strain Okayama-7 / 130 / ATCC MYA-4618 / FGSC 9003) TaxID=240176 RepID=A8NRH0_COPC7|nr:hypothetical protein CC1G_11687 [Coprinopsis cinerea okayama7\|eukprot:XP_001835782.1 hypothetical protein CC1G_11687 [Coprinopsis cinerea okayama7\